MVLDRYGNAIDITDNGVKNYAVVLKLKNNAGDYNDTPKADLLLTDGTVVESVNLTNNKASGDAAVYSGSAESGQEINANDIVSYTINNKDKYTLTHLASDAKERVSITNNSAVMDLDVDNVTTGVAGGQYVANGKTIFLVVSGTKNDPIYSAYTGIKNVPTILSKDGEDTINAVYCNNSNGVATLVYVDVRGTATINTEDTIFVQSVSNPKKTVDAVYGEYWTYDAIVNGEITRLNVSEIVPNDALFDNVSYVTYSDGAKVATLNNYVDVAHTTVGTMVNGMFYYVGVQKLTNGSIGLDYKSAGNYYATSIVPADDCEVFYIDADDEIQASSVSAIATDTDDIVFVKVVNGEATTIIVDAMAKNSTSGNTPVVNPNVQIVNADAGNGYANPTFYIASGATLSTMEMREALNAKMIADGCSNISWNGSTVTFTKSGYQYSTSVTLTQVYEVKLASAYGVNINVGYVAASKDLTVVLGNGVLGTNWTGATNTNINVVTDNGISFSVKSATAAADGQSITVVLTAPAAMKDTSATLSYK